MSEFAPPILCVWEKGVFRPARKHAELRAQKYFSEGQEYALVEHHERSEKSHAHYFAAVADSWRNLPEILAQEFASPDHLRKYALIKCGFYNSDSSVWPNAATAERVAAVMRPVDEFSIIVTEGNIVRRFTAKSQTYRAMSREEFRLSKDAVLDFISSLIGTTRAALERNAATVA